MGVIFFSKNLIWQMLQCAHILSLINALTNCEFVLRCCAECPHINILDQERNKKHKETTPYILFQIYHNI